MLRRLALVLLALLLPACALAGESRYAQVFDPAADDGLLSVRFLWLGPKVADDKPGDAMILTAHIGGFPTLLSRYEVGTVCASALTYEDSSYYRAFLEALRERGIELTVLAEGDSLAFGEVTVDVLNPPREIDYPDNYPEGATQFINNQSLALRFTWGDSSFLLAGDLYSGAERALAERWGEALDCDVMKANHHGDGTSSSLTWREAVSPEITS